MVDELEFQSSSPTSFSGWRENKLLFDVDIVNLLLKNNGAEAKGLTSLFM